jgi:HAMP domain-containing protein/HPt (histidine-containing phosphotransfer) domain-containing protein
MSEPGKAPEVPVCADVGASASLSSEPPRSGVSAAPTAALEQLPELGVGIRVKLVGLMVAMIFVVVGAMASYFLAREIEELRGAAYERALVYARLASRQLTSAVAFDDRETAREVLSAVAGDPMIDSIAVYTAQGKDLLTEGAPSELARRTARGVSAKAAAYYLPGRVLATAPIKSLEGAEGTVTLELSTRAVRAAQRRLVIAALWIGAAALLLGSALAWLIARSLARRIEAIAGAASAMSRGELSHALDVSGPNDEIGLLGHGFNAMRAKLSDLVAHIQRVAREESARLERLVMKRTQQLDNKNRDLRLVLDNVEQGFVTIGRDALVSGEHSLAIRNWFGELNERETIWKQLTRSEPNLEHSFWSNWQQVVEDALPLEVALDQMPRRMRLGERHLCFEYRPIGGEQFERLLVVISDVSASVAREQSEQAARELVTMTTRLLHDPQAFKEFMEEGQRLLDQVRDDRADITKLKRDLHTLKGNTALFGLSRVSRLCHELETQLEERSLGELDSSRLVSVWEQCSTLAQRLLGQRNTTAIEIDPLEYQKALQMVKSGAPMHEVLEMMRCWSLEPLRGRLQSVAHQLVSVAASLGKGSVAVNVDTQDVYLHREELREFWAAFSHVVRNAALHGLDSERRGQSRQDAAADFDLHAGIEEDRLFIEIADTGPGIDWDGIRERASARGLPHATQADLEDALFMDGISTRRDVSELAGRGVGLSAVRAACARKRGRIQVATQRGRGTSFRFSWPAAEFPTLVHLHGSEGRA